jgi:hypothetical protein
MYSTIDSMKQNEVGTGMCGDNVSFRTYLIDIVRYSARCSWFLNVEFKSLGYIYTSYKNVPWTNTKRPTEPSFLRDNIRSAGQQFPVS